MPLRVYLVALLLFISGMCSLIYQVAWMREFRLVFGATTLATAAVTAIFMGGLGLGNALLGRRVDQSSRPMRFYAKLELLTGAAVALTPLLVLVARHLYAQLGGQMVLGSFGATVARLFLSALVLGVPTFLMGGTLPALSKVVTTADDPHRRRVALLYGLNTLGAVLGAAICTFVLLEVFGTRLTLWVACLINIVEGLAAWQVARLYGEHLGDGALSIPVTAAMATGNGGGIAAPAEASSETEISSTQRSKKKKKRGQRPQETASVAERASASAGNLPPSIFYFAAAVVGFTFFLMELVWFRMLAPVLGGTTYTFGLILAVALFGIGIGGAAYNLFYRNSRPTLASFGLTCALEALLIAYPFALGDQLAVLALLLRDLGVFGFYGMVAGWAVVAAIVVLPAAFVAGVQFPILVALVGSGGQDVGKQVGLTFAWNTVGAILGSLAGGFLAMPLLSALGSWMLVVVLLVLLAVPLLLLALRQQTRLPQVVFPLLLAGVALVCMQARGPTAVWRHGAIGAGRGLLDSRTQVGLQRWKHDMRRWIVAAADGVEASVAIAAQDGFSFLVNGKSDGSSIGDADSFIMPGLIGALLHPDPQTALVVGLGTGETAGWLAEVQSMEQLDVIELEPVVAQVAQMCAPINFDVLNHPKVNLSYNDAREVLLTFPQKYDLIISQPSNPYRAGVAGLFTQEYYAGVKERMQPQGLFLQWMQAYEIDAATVSTVFATLDSQFDYVELWQTNMSDMLFVCSMQPLEHSAAEMRAKIRQHPYPQALRVTWNVDDLEGVLARYIANHQLVKQVSRNAEMIDGGERFDSSDARGSLGLRAMVERIANIRPNINTDDMNRLEYGSARFVGKLTGFSLADLFETARRNGFNRPSLEGEVDWESVLDQRVNMGLKDKSFALQYQDEHRKARAVALASYLAGNMAKTVHDWETQPREPEHAAEIAVLAHAYAATGSEKALPLIARLEEINPVEAEAMRAVMHYLQRNYAAAANSLEQVFAALHENPWPHFVEHAFPLALDVARQDPSQAVKLYNALRSPLAVYRYNGARLLVLWRLATAVGPQVAAECIESYEPWVPWNKKFLENRVMMYRQVNHPLLPVALADLQQFNSQLTTRSLSEVGGQKPTAGTSAAEE